MQLDTQQAVDSLVSTTCPACGRPKGSRKSLCARCYYALPKQMQRDLYRPVGAGYEEALDAALKHHEVDTPFLEATE